ncbi:carbohydrate porin, partial [Cyanobacteria bacterium 150NLHA]
LAILKGRVDGLEARVGELEATQFSTTTKLVGQTTFVIGANSFGGDAVDSRDKKRADEAAENSGGTVFNYDLRLNLNTSFTGKDLLKTRLRSGNFGSSPFGGGQYVGLDAMEVASSTGDTVTVDRLWYQFPLGDEFTMTVGPKVRQDNMLAVWPSAYPADTVIDFFTYAGAPGTYNLTLGGGGGIWWDDSDSGWSISASYVSANADNGNPNNDRSGRTQGGGIATDGAASNGTVQLAYADDRWGAAAAYNYASSDNGAGLYAGNGTPLANDVQAMGVTNSVGISAWWSPAETGWMPSVSAGWGLNSVTEAGDDANTIYESATSQSWYVGLQWEDAFIEGNVLGAAVGQPTFVTDIDYDDGVSSTDDPNDNVADGNYAFELWYKFQVTDNISVTPAVFYLSRPYGENTDGGGRSFGNDDDTFSNFGGLVKTTFKF